MTHTQFIKYYSLPVLGLAILSFALGTIVGNNSANGPIRPGISVATSDYSNIADSVLRTWETDPCAYTYHIQLTPDSIYLMDGGKKVWATDFKGELGKVIENDNR